MMVLLPIQTINELNGNREHWSKVSRRRKSIRMVAKVQTPQHPLPCVVTMTRLSAGTLDGDGLQAALKSVRDGIADKLQVNDNSPLVEWRYAQEKVPRGTYGVRIELGGKS